jgi:hypothetical protein
MVAEVRLQVSLGDYEQVVEAVFSHGANPALGC